MPLILCLLLACLLPAAEVVNANVASADLAPEVREASTFSAKIAVQNPYQRAVRIERLDSTCSCTTLEIASRFLLPGEVTILDIASDNLRRSGPQQTRVSLFLTDPDLEPIEVWCWWRVREAVSVDAIAPGEAALERPTDVAWRDIYRFVAHERPDEPQRLRKRIRLAAPAGDVPGGLRVEGIDYPGTLWKFSSRTLENGAIIVTAESNHAERMPLGTFHDTVVIRTNHPDKPRIELQFEALIDSEAGRKAIDPMQ